MNLVNQFFVNEYITVCHNRVKTRLLKRHGLTYMCAIENINLISIFLKK